MFMCSVLGAGRRLCRDKGCLVTETVQEWAYVCLASFVCEILLAKRAIPALKIASFGAGGRFGGKVLQVMFARGFLFCIGMTRSGVVMRDESVYGDVLKRPRKNIFMKRKRDGARFIREPSQEGTVCERRGEIVQAGGLGDDLRVHDLAVDREVDHRRRRGAGDKTNTQSNRNKNHSENGNFSHNLSPVTRFINFSLV